MAQDQPEQLGDALGPAPHIPLLLQPFDTSHFAGSPPCFAATLGRKASLGEVHGLLCARLDVPSSAVTIMFEGRDLEGGMSLEENEVHLPGPAARRAGEKVRLFFNVDRGVVQAALAVARREQDEAEAAVQKQAVLSKQMEQQARQDDWWQCGGAERELDAFIEARMGRSRARVEELCAVDREPEPRHFLEACEETQRAAMEDLMNRTWQGNQRRGPTRVTTNVSLGEVTHCISLVRLLRVENTVLKDRQVRARELLRAGANVQRRSTASGDLIGQGGIYACLGEFDASVNEFPLWHGTPMPESVQGICSTGFDIAYAGASVGSAFAPGFYFATNSSVSHGYAKSPWHVNAKYSSMHVMLLCRVLCGNLRETLSPPNEEEKERLTAMCLGPGGSFGAGSEFHAVLGGGWAYVAMHRDQVYPEFVAVYSSDAPSGRNTKPRPKTHS